jgi:hypothetical protein
MNTVGKKKADITCAKVLSLHIFAGTEKYLNVCLGMETSVVVSYVSAYLRIATAARMDTNHRKWLSKCYT